MPFPTPISLAPRVKPEGDKKSGRSVKTSRVWYKDITYKDLISRMRGPGVVRGARGDGDRLSRAGAKPPARRRRIGLALGSGGARGWAHVGVLRALDAAGIRPDVVAGTSIGALIAGVHLAGHLPTLEAWARKLTRPRLLAYLDPRMSGGGLIGGQRMLAFMARHLGDLKVEELPVPFVAVTTDLSTGHEVWLHGVHIPEYRQGTWTNHQPRRVRKMLLNRHEIDKIDAKITERGFTLVPLSLYFKDGRAKVEIALARGKKSYDKRHAIAERQANREKQQALGRRLKGHE